VPATILTESFDGPLAKQLGRARADAIAVNWLGQAGFVVEAGSARVVIDPYLSDSLEAKYRGSVTPHDRMMPPPVTIEELGDVDFVLLTHHHTDHMDPGTLMPLARLRPRARFVAPRASREEALRRTGANEDRLILMDAGETLSPLPGIRITALRAAHETLERDANGCFRFLGYGLTIELPGKKPVALVHTGDTIPFEGQRDEIARLKPDLLMAPVNGRSAQLAALGIAGNLTLDEAVDLAASAAAPAMIAHHHGMFAFNTTPLSTIEAKAADPARPIRLLPARLGMEVRLKPT